MVAFGAECSLGNWQWQVCKSVYDKLVVEEILGTVCPILPTAE
jgi:hypothetical protein